MKVSGEGTGLGGWREEENRGRKRTEEGNLSVEGGMGEWRGRLREEENRGKKKRDQPVCGRRNGRTEGGRRGTNLSAKVPSLLGHPVDGGVQSITPVLLASLERERERAGEG